MIAIWQYYHYHLQFANCCSKTFSAKFANCVLDHFQQIVIPNHIFANCHSEPFPWTLFIICSVISQIVILDYFANLAESFWISFCKLSFRVIFLLLLTVVADHFLPILQNVELQKVQSNEKRFLEKRAFRKYLVLRLRSAWFCGLWWRILLSLTIC